MSIRDPGLFDPLRLDVAAFANKGAELRGSWPLASLARLAEGAPDDAPVGESGAVNWSAQGELRATRGAEPQVWLHVQADARVPMQCQRCLKAVRIALHIDRQFHFVHGEDAAAQLDADSEDDVLAFTRSLDLRELVEDELLLAMPIVPRHEICPDPLLAPASDELADEDAPHPFAALAALRRPPLN